MTPRRFNEGQDFEFPPEFGFTGSAQGRHDARPHPTHNMNEFGASAAKGYQVGGPVAPQPMPAPPPQRKPPVPVDPDQLHMALRGAAKLGAMGALHRLASRGRQQRQQMQAAPEEAQPMAEGGKFIQTAVKRPGRLKRLAKKHGVSLGQEIAKDVHSSDPSLRSAAVLGRRFRSGEFKKGK